MNPKDLARLLEQDLDFDDDVVTQGADVSQAAPDVHMPLPENAAQLVKRPEFDDSLDMFVRALHIAQHLYGQSHSRFSSFFNTWCSEALRGRLDYTETYELAMMLRKERKHYNGSFTSLVKGRTLLMHQKAIQMKARMMACRCASSCIRAALNKLKGLDNSIWLDQVFYYATLTDQDRKDLK